MAEVLLSPGVLLSENDTSQITAGTITAGLSLVGPTVKGRVNVPTLVTSYSDFRSKFGDLFVSSSTNYEYLTSIAAFNYFQQGGDTILVTRITSGSYTPATASVDNASSTLYSGSYASASYTFYTGSATPTDGEITTIKVVNGSTVYQFVPTGAVQFTNDPTNNIYYFATQSVATVGFASSSLGNFLVSASAVLGSTGANLLSFAAGSPTALAVTASALNVGKNYNDIVITDGTLSQYYDINYSTIGYVVVGNAHFNAVTQGGTNPFGLSFTLETLSEGANMNNQGAFLSNGALVSGSADNIRWQIVSPDSASGTFTVIIRQGNDTTSNPSVLETWNNVSLDPNQANYIERVIGNYTQVPTFDPSNGQWYLKGSGSYANASRYVRVSSVVTPTYNYFRNDGTPNPAYFAYLPYAGSGSLGGAFNGATGNDTAVVTNMYENIGTITQGVNQTNYAIAADLLSNTDEYDFQLVTTPGLLQIDHSSTITRFINICENRGDCFYITDMAEYGSALNVPGIQANAMNTNYAATYWPWVQVLSQATGKLVWVPASTVMPGVYAFNDKVAAEWFAPAGLNRGGVGGALQAERKLGTSDRDTLYQNKVNPIASFPGVGLVAYGQKTLQTKASALDRVNVRRLLINLKRFVRSVSETLLFENNTLATRNNFIASVNPYLESVQQRQGLYAYKVVMDDSNNTPDTIDRNQLVGAIYIQPAKAIEFIYIDFNITPTGVTFGA